MKKSNNKIPTWTSKTPGQYGSNGINSDGSLMNIGNKLGDKPSIRLFPEYNSGDTMRNLISDCGGLGNQKISPVNNTSINQRLLWEAARKGDTELVKSVIENKADPLLVNLSDGNWTALHYAAANNRLITCKYLISLPSAKKQCLALNNCGQTPKEASNSTSIFNLLTL